MFGRSVILLASFYFRIFIVDCASNSGLSSFNYSFDNVLEVDTLYPPTVKTGTITECYDGLCQPFEICYEEEDPDTKEAFAMCKCVDGDDRCDHKGIAKPASDFNALAVEKYEILRLQRALHGEREIPQSRSIQSCSRKCRPYEICLSIRGDEICVPERTCDKESKPCNNGGTCHRIGNGGSACQCLNNFSGDQCDVNITICSLANPCANRGKCIIVNGQSKCNCLDGYFGIRCKEVRKPTLCDSKPCPSGQCRKMTSGRFACVYGPCDSKRNCNGHGSCWIANGGPTFCDCDNGWNGDRCERPTDPCSPNPCPAGESCVTKFSSSSQLNYTCMVNENPCHPNPCKGDCKCKSSCKHEGGYFCYGGSGYLGKNCDIPAPKIACNADVIQIGVDARIVEEYSGGKIGFVVFMSRFHSFANSTGTGCFANEDAGFYNFSVPLPFTKCGVVVSEGSDVTHVSGKIWLNRFFGMAEMAIPVVEFACRYQKQYRVVTSLVPARLVWHSAKETVGSPTVENTLNDLPFEAPLSEHGKLRGSANMELCKTGVACPRLCPAAFSLKSGALYTVNERIHIRIMPRIKESKLYLTDLHLSCSPNATRISEAVDLLTKSCMPVATGRSLNTRVVNAGGGVCLSFRAPLFEECSRFYVHARLEECYQKCDTAYHGCRFRHKRSDKIGQNHIFGPIYSLDIHDGAIESVSYLGDRDEEDASTLKTDVAEHTWLLIALTLICVCVILLMSLLIAYHWRNARCGKLGIF